MFYVKYQRQFKGGNNVGFKKLFLYKDKKLTGKKFEFLE